MSAEILTPTKTGERMTTSPLDAERSALAAQTEARSSAAASSAIRVSLAEPAHDADRDRYVDAHPRGTLFHLAPWRRAVVKTFGHDSRDLVAWRGPSIVGVLPLVKCRGPLGLAHLISVPYGVYGGPIGDSPEVEAALCDKAIEIAEREHVGRLELRCFADLGLDLLPSNLYATFVHELPPDPADVMKRMPKRARAEVRKSIEKHKLELSHGPWYLRDMVSLFHSSKQHLGSPGLPGKWFESLLGELGERAVVHLARRGKQPIAATMSFVHKDTFLFYYIGTTADGNREYNVTNYLCTKLQEESIERGLKRFDLGRSRVDSGAFSFKVHQGFEPTPLNYRYKLVRSKSLPSFTPSNPRTKLLRDTWTKLPPWLATRLSDRLSRYLP
jgi:FemAB-related protein (PEP-CTERM system-associated)